MVKNRHSTRTTCFCDVCKHQKFDRHVFKVYCTSGRLDVCPDCWEAFQDNLPADFEYADYPDTYLPF